MCNSHWEADKSNYILFADDAFFIGNEEVHSLARHLQFLLFVFFGL